MAIHAILFDHDGTLVDSETIHCRMWTQVLQSHGVVFSEALYKAHHAGVPTAANAVDIVARFGLPVAADELARAKDAAVTAYLARDVFPLMPGALEAIAFFRRAGLRQAVVTGARRHGVESSLRGHGLAGSFSTVVSADDVPRSKPAPDCYQLALERLGLQPHECVAIEDTEHGVEAAHSAGIDCVAVPHGLSEHHDFGRATAVLRDLYEAVEWITRRYAIAP